MDTNHSTVSFFDFVFNCFHLICKTSSSWGCSILELTDQGNTLLSAALHLFDTNLFRTSILMNGSVLKLLKASTTNFPVPKISKFLWSPLCPFVRLGKGSRTMVVVPGVTEAALLSRAFSRAWTLQSLSKRLSGASAIFVTHTFTPYTLWFWR